jgi:hypothetical protein
MKTTRTLMLLSILSAMCYRTMFAQSPSFSRSDVDTGLHLSGAVVVGDFNGDGKPDLLATALSKCLRSVLRVLQVRALRW